MRKIKKLTKAQQASLAEFRDKWTAIGLSTEPADRPRAEAAILDSYKAAGLEPPKKIIWCGSPLSQGLVRAIILNNKLIEDIGTSVGDSVGDSVWDSVRASVRDSVRDSVWDSVGASVWASVRASVWDSVRDSVRDSVGASVWDSVGASVGDSVGASVRASVRDSVWDSVRDSVRDSVGASVRASVWDSVWDSVRDSVGASVWDSVGDSVGASVGDSVGDSVYGQHDANWIGFYEYFRLVLSLNEQTDKLQGLTELAKSAGWALPHQNICWVSERHCVLQRDDRGRLHSLAGPAVAYPDGWAVYAVHGVRCPADIIEQPKSITVPRIDGEQNAEIRRVMIERYGMERYLIDSKAAVLDEDKDSLGLPRKLVRKERPGDEPIVAVFVKNSTLEPDGTRKDYLLRVPPQMTNVKQAVAWTFGKEASDYSPEKET